MRAGKGLFPGEDEERAGAAFKSSSIHTQTIQTNIHICVQEKDFFLERMKDELERLKAKLMRTEMRKLKVCALHTYIHTYICVYFKQTYAH